MPEATMWLAPLAGPDEAGWIALGTVSDDGLIFEAEPIAEEWTVPALHTITLTAQGRYDWRFWQLFFGTPGPPATRVKREYRRRRR